VPPAHRKTPSLRAERAIPRERLAPDGSIDRAAALGAEIFEFPRNGCENASRRREFERFGNQA